MKNLILTLLLAVFSVAFVTAGPPDWESPKYEKFTDIKTDIAVENFEAISVSPVDQSYASIRTEAGTRIQSNYTKTPVDAITYLRFSDLQQKRWQSLRYKGKSEFISNSKYLRSTIYNTARVGPQLE